MKVQFKKLLPQIMRDTRWGDLIDVYQNMTSTLRDDLISPIFDQYTIEGTLAEKIKIGAMLGFTILTFPDTYTATEEYINRQIATIVKRINTKNSKNSYRYTGSIYNLYIEVYPIFYSTSGNLSGKLNTLCDYSSQIQYSVLYTDQEGDNIYYNKDVVNWDTDTDLITTLDMSGYLDETTTIYGTPQATGLSEAYTDTEASYETDATASSSDSQTGNAITQITRNILFCYYHNFLENENEWLSVYSLKALKNDINQIHRITEMVYYEPWLQFETSATLETLTNKTYYNYDFSVSGQIHSILKGSSLLEAQYIQFGTGSHYSDISGIPVNVSGVQSLAYCIPSGVVSGVTYLNLPSGVAGWSLFDTATPHHLDFDMILSEKNKFTEFTELALLDETSGCIYYATFPKIQWAPNMYNNIRIKINLA
jgi:hypothetical protein